MPGTSDAVGFLYKKQYGVSDTETARKYYEEPFAARQTVYSSQIYSNDIPTTNPLASNFSDLPDTINGVVQVKINVILSAVPGAPSSFYSAQLIDSIPHNYDKVTGTYNYKLTKSDGVTLIPFGLGDWIVDNAGGVLRFYGTLPSGVSSLLPPRISFFKYVGSKGVSSGFINSITNIGTSGESIFKNLTSGNTNANFYKINSVDAGLTITTDLIGNKIDLGLSVTNIDHNSLANLAVGDSHTQYTLLAGRTGGQTITGGVDAADNLILRSTTNALKGAVVIPERLRIGNTTNNTITGHVGLKKILASDGNTQVTTIVLNNTAKQYVTVRIIMTAWLSNADDIEDFIVTFRIQNNILNNNITHDLIHDVAIGPNFTIVDGIGNNTLSIYYNGLTSDVIVGSFDYIVNGPNHINDITIA